MLSKLVRSAVDNPFVVALATVLLVVLGLRAMSGLPVDAVPDVTNVQVQVMTTAPALGPAEVEQFITFPVETAMSGMPRVEEIRSVSQFGLSVVTVVFEEGTDIYWARQLVGERLQSARENIPAEVGSPAELRVESRVGEETLNALAAMGHNVVRLGPWGARGAVQVIARDPETGVLAAASDPRSEGQAIGL